MTLRVPDNLRYTAEHEWLDIEGEGATVGITAYAVSQLGEVVFLELVQPGTELEKGDVFGTVESVKAVSDLYMPLRGTITEANGELVAKPEVLNNDAYGAGWMVRIAIGAAEAAELLDSASYLGLIAE